MEFVDGGLFAVACALLFATSLMLKHVSLATISFTCFTSVFFTFFYTYVAATFGFMYFGVLVGVIMCIAGFVNYLQVR
jgi:hypothetical protein